MGISRYAPITPGTTSFRSDGTADRETGAMPAARSGRAHPGCRTDYPKQDFPANDLPFLHILCVTVDRRPITQHFLRLYEYNQSCGWRKDASFQTSSHDTRYDHA